MSRPVFRRDLFTAALSPLVGTPISIAASRDSPGARVARWPILIAADGRHLRRPDGTPWMAFGDSPWSLCVNCNRPQILRYLDDRSAKGCNAILFSAVEARWSNQRPYWRNTEGVAPFTRMRPVNWQMQPRYWETVDFVVEQAALRDMACFIAPAYAGYGNGTDGWLPFYRHASGDMLRNYGMALGRRYRQGNVVWVLGGDDANDRGALGRYGDAATRVRSLQWQIALGIRSVQPDALITGHTARNGMPGQANGEAYKAWGQGFVGFNLNNLYARDGNDDVPDLARRAWDRPGPMPFFLIEAGYEDLDGRNVNGLWPAIQSVLCGGLAGFFGGHDALWHFGSQKPTSGAQSVLDQYLSGSWLGLARLASVLRHIPWETLRPHPVGARSGLKSRPSSQAVCAAMSKNRDYALIWSPETQLEVDSEMISKRPVELRWIDPFAHRERVLSRAHSLRDGTILTLPGPGLVEARAT